MMESLISSFPSWMIKRHHQKAGRNSYFTNGRVCHAPSRKVERLGEGLSRFIPRHTLSYDCFYDLVRRCLVVDPYERITASSALSHPFFSLGIHQNE